MMVGSTTKLTMSASESSWAPTGEYCPVSRATNPSRKSKRAAASMSTNATRNAPAEGSDTIEMTATVPHSRLASVMILGSVISFAFMSFSLFSPVSSAKVINPNDRCPIPPVISAVPAPALRFTYNAVRLRLLPFSESGSAER